MHESDARSQPSSALLDPPPPHACYCTSAFFRAFHLLLSRRICPCHTRAVFISLLYDDIASHPSHFRFCAIPLPISCTFQDAIMDFDRSDYLSGASSPLSSIGRTPSPPPVSRPEIAYPSPPASQDSSHSGSPCPDGMDSSATLSDKDGPPPAKRRRISEKKPRTTEYLDLRTGIAKPEEQEQLDRLMNVLHNRRKIVVVAGAGISVSAGSKYINLFSNAPAKYPPQYLTSAPLLGCLHPFGPNTTSKDLESTCLTRLFTRMTLQPRHSTRWSDPCLR